VLPIRQMEPATRNLHPYLDGGACIGRPSAWIRPKSGCGCTAGGIYNVETAETPE
jgi:hypothetical protein